MKYKIKFTGKNYTAVLKFLMTHAVDSDDFSLVNIKHSIIVGWYFDFSESHVYGGYEGNYWLGEGDSLEFNPEKRYFEIHEKGEKKWW